MLGEESLLVGAHPLHLLKLELQAWKNKYESIYAQIGAGKVDSWRKHEQIVITDSVPSVLYISLNVNVFLSLKKAPPGG